MAYTPKQNAFGPEEEQQGQIGAPGAPTAPTISGPTIGSTASVGGTASGNSAAAPQNEPQSAAPGTGFVNIDKYIGANQGAGKDLEASASKVRSVDDKNFGEAKGKFDSEVNKRNPGNINVTDIVNRVVGPAQGTPTIGSPGEPTTQNGPRQARGLEQGSPQAQGKTWVNYSEGGGYWQDPEPVPFTPDPLAISQASNILSNQYSGPTSLGYDVGNTKEAKQAAALGNADSAGTQMAELGGPLALYNPQLAAIDRAIYGNATGSLDAIQKANKGSVDAQTAGKKASEGKAGDVSRKIEDQKSALRDALTGRADSIIQDVQGRANLAAESQRVDQDKGIVRDAAGNITNAQAGAWQGGSTPQANQFFQGSDLSSLQQIGRLLGDESLAGMQSGGTFQPGRYDPVAPEQKAADPLAGLDSGRRDYVQILIDQGIDPTQAMAAAKNVPTTEVEKFLKQHNPGKYNPQPVSTITGSRFVSPRGNP